MPEVQLSKDYALDIGQIDCRGIARPSAIVDFMQDIATRHAVEMGIGGEALAKKNAFWVLSRVKYVLDRPLHLFDVVNVTTWPRQIKGASWYRDFAFRVDGQPVGHAVTMWAIVDLTTRRLLRPKSLGMDITPQLVGEQEVLKSLHAEQQETCFSREVRYSDIDINRHLNNVKAVDILSDAFGLEHNETRWVSQMQINYIHETICGTTLDIVRGTGKNGLYVAAKDGEQENVQAEVVFSQL